MDWSWPTRGVAFIDPAQADPRAIDAFAAATLRMYRQFARREPDAARLAAMASAAESWAAHRGVNTA